MKLANRNWTANRRRAAASAPRHFIARRIRLPRRIRAVDPRRPSAGQQTKETLPDIKPFLGTWKASLKGEVFAILVVREDRGSVAGTLNNFDIGRDKDGNLNDDTHKDFGDGPLLNVRIKSGALYFVAIQKDQYAPSTEWKFVPKNAQEGELTQLIDGQPYSPNGSVPKPILMVRERTKQP